MRRLLVLVALLGVVGLIAPLATLGRPEQPASSALAEQQSVMLLATCLNFLDRLGEGGSATAHRVAAVGPRAFIVDHELGTDLGGPDLVARGCHR